MAGKHLTPEQRIKIEAYVKIKKGVCEIARLLGVSHSTISRELRRGRYPHLHSDLYYIPRYSADIAQQKYDYAQTSKGRPLKIGSNHAYAKYLERMVVERKYSPAAALATAKRLKRFRDCGISVGTFYNYIRAGLFLHLASKDLPVGIGQKKQSYRKIQRIKNPLVPCITERPEWVNDRSEFGHWEMDTVVSGRGGRAALLVLTERVTRVERIIKMPDKTTASVVAAMNRLEAKTPHFCDVFKSITMDNGAEFADYIGISRSIYGGVRTAVYFCRPYSAWERGSNEVANKLIRRFIPKGADIGRYTQKQIATLERWINNYPRRIFEYQSANDMYRMCVGL